MTTRRGFTLIELLVVMAIISTLLAVALPRYYGSVKRAEEATLRQNLALMRDAIDKHYGDTGRYPDTLDELVAKRYLRALPRDPVTGAADTWVVTAPPSSEPGRVYDVKSGSTATALDGTTFDTW
ncbi:MAG TPA: type II secretion system protein [Gemmatimonadales bacterium]|nr:type II secretion system protein [Gemmatimonadales bacterium]